jgi:hypothetical protein
MKRLRKWVQRNQARLSIGAATAQKVIDQYDLEALIRETQETKQLVEEARAPLVHVNDPEDLEQLLAGNKDVALMERWKSLGGGTWEVISTDESKTPPEFTAVNVHTKEKLRYHANGTVVDAVNAQHDPRTLTTFIGVFDEHGNQLDLEPPQDEEQDETFLPEPQAHGDSDN